MLIEQLVKPFGVETDHNFFPNDYRGSGTAAIGANKFEHGGLITADVAFFVEDASRREVGLYKLAGRSTGLREEQDAGLGHGQC